MPETKPHVLAHAVFLQRVSDHPPTAPLVRLGQGAFLALRLLDLLAPDRDPPASDVFRYQSGATERYCDDLFADGPEAAHISGLVRITAEAYRVEDIRLVAPAMLAYGHYLEDEGHYAEGEDVLESLLRVGADRLAAADRVAALLRVARVRRKMAQFDEAVVAYEEAGALARSSGDEYSSLLSRLGLANVLWGRGNVSEAERQLHGVLIAARSLRHRDAEARAEHGLGTVLGSRSYGRPDASVGHLWRAFELYEDEASRIRTLGDLAFSLMSLGQYAAAEGALTIVVRSPAATSENIVHAVLELMNCASARRDRVGFERWRGECEARRDVMPPNALADFFHKLGIGQARFGNFKLARSLFDDAIAVAGQHSLRELEFRFERVKNGLQECEAELLPAVASAPLEPELVREEVREVSASLAALAQMSA